MPPTGCPSFKELTAKLREARIALDSFRFAAIEPATHLAADIIELRSKDANDHFKRVRRFLDEIEAAGGARCHAAKARMHRYKDPQKGLELFPFAWDSPSMKKRMYLKFAIKHPKANPYFYYLNCHEDDPTKRDR